MKVIIGGIAILLVIVAGIVLINNTQKPSLLREETTIRDQSISVSPQPSSESAQLQQDEKIAMKQYNSAPTMTISPNKTYTVTMATSKGSMRFVLYPKDAPNAVNNFVFLSREGFYSNTVFHRIIKGFMIQGGDPMGTGRGGPGYQFADEPITKDYTRGTLAMANSGPNTNGSQFFVMHEDNDLPKNYVIFGSIEANDTQSFATLDALASTPVVQSETGERSKPSEEITLYSMYVEEL